MLSPQSKKREEYIFERVRNFVNLGVVIDEIDKEELELKNQFKYVWWKVRI